MADQEENVVEIKTFEEHLENKTQLPNERIIERIDEGTHPFNRNTFFAYNPAKLASTEFKRCVDIYNERTPNGTAQEAGQLMFVELVRDERPHKKELEDLAIEIVKEMYNVPDSLDLRALLAKPDESECDECEPPEEDKISDERKLELQPEIEKRRILNSIVHGQSILIWQSAYYIAAEKLNELNPTLVDKYNRLSSLVNYWNWILYSEQEIPILQGINKIDIKEKKIEATGMNFPVLIHELSKGVIDYLISIGIPELPPNELRYIYAEADKYSHEPWHYYFGPTLWDSILETSDVESQNLPPIISEMAKMNYVELSNFCIDIVFHKEEIGNKKMSTFKKQCQ